MMKTVYMICPFAKPNIGGVESHIEKLLTYLSRNNHKVILLTYQPLTTNAKGATYEKKDNVEIYRVLWFGKGWFTKLEPYFPLVFLYLFPGLFWKSLILYLKRNKEIDVIHAHGFIAAVITKILKKIQNKRCVISTHAIYNLQNRKILASIVKWMMRNFDAVLAVGMPSREELISIGLDEKKIEIHPNWIDINIYRPLSKYECRKFFNLSSEDLNVLFIGRLIEIKGVLVIRDAANKTNKNIKFIFVGDGPLVNEIQISSIINSKIKYFGKLTDEDIIKAYNAADVFLSPVIYEEGFATVYLESLACGTPVVTANRGCLPYFLNNSVADLLDNITVEDVLKKLEYYYDNRDILSKKREFCRKYAEKNFSDKNADIILDSY